MAKKSFALYQQEMCEYVEGILGLKKDKELNYVLDKAAKAGTPLIQITPEEGRILEVVARSIKSQKIVEIGTLCGFSTVFLARGLSDSGIIYTCEKSPHHAKIARDNFEKLGLSNKIKILEGCATESLRTLEQEGPFDLVFIDAQKQLYPFFLDWAIKNVRPAGIIVADNVFLAGKVFQKQNYDDSELQKIVSAVREFNKIASSHPLLLVSYIPTEQGLMIASKLEEN